MAIIEGSLRLSLPTPDCPKCGSTDYEDAGKVGMPRKWVCVRCGGEMPSPLIPKKDSHEQTYRSR